MSTRTLRVNNVNVTKNPKSFLYTLAELINDLVAGFNELRTDHATTKVTVDQLETLAEELGTDHGTTKVTVDQLETLAEELATDHETTRLLTADLKTLANNLRTYVADGLNAIGTLAKNGAGDPAFKTTTTPIFTINGVTTYTTISTNTFTSAYTVNTTATATTMWGVFLVQIAVTGTISTKAPSLDQTYTTEASAIAALPTAATNNVSLGYITVNTSASATFTANTTQLVTGSVANVKFYDTTIKSCPAVITTSAPATLTASGSITSGPATLTAAIAITSGPATLTAAAVDDITLRELGTP